jgi:predicted ATPase
METLKIDNFKCFYGKEIQLNDLTVLAGANGNGKSTVIQTLLFLRRTVEHCALWIKGKGDSDGHYRMDATNGLNVELNGAYMLNLGNSSYILPRDSNQQSCGIFLNSGANSFSVVYKIGTEDLWLEPFDVHKDKDFPFNKSSLFKQEFYYLNAERLGPRINQGMQFYDFPNTGYQGEFVAQLLGDMDFVMDKKNEIPEERMLEPDPRNRLDVQVNKWLDYLMPGVRIEVEFKKETLSAQIRIDNNYNKGKPTISTNIGFGISYVLPILVTGLIAKKGAYMIVENPEAHLHPSAQSRLGRFLAQIANSGVKVILETHSDHIINGIQVAAAKNQINPEKVTINFFEHTGENQPEVTAISVNEIGELSHWPRGFFDQSQEDFSQLFKLRKK